MKKKLYISIPISGKDITEVKLHLDFVKNRLISKLYEPVTPFDVYQIPTHLMRNTWGETFRLSWNAMQSFSAVDGKTAKDVRLNTK